MNLTKFISKPVYVCVGRNKMSNDRVLDLLEAANWDEIILDLVNYSLWQARRYKWRSGNATQLPEGKTPTDIALGAIEKVWSKTRGWDSDKYPDLLTHLKWIVKSDMQHLFLSKEHQITSSMPEFEDGTENVTNYSERDQEPSAEEQLIIKEKEKKLMDELAIALKGDEELELLLMCIEDGIVKAEAIALETSWDITRVYNAKRRFHRLTSKILIQSNLM